MYLLPTFFVGCDGWIRVWDLESICNAKASDSDSDKAIFHLDPMNEVEVEGICFCLQLFFPSAVYLLSIIIIIIFPFLAGAVLKSIAKSKIDAEDNNDWFIQDSTGSIWKVDLSFSLNMQKPCRIYRYIHAYRKKNILKTQFLSTSKISSAYCNHFSPVLTLSSNYHLQVFAR